MYKIYTMVLVLAIQNSIDAQDFDQVRVSDMISGTSKIFDVDEDGDFDIVGYNHNFNRDEHELYILYNDGNAQPTFERVLIMEGANLIGDILVNDYNNDGMLDYQFTEDEGLTLFSMNIVDNKPTNIRPMGIDGSFVSLGMDVNNDGNLEFIGRLRQLGIINLYVNFESESYQKIEILNVDGEIIDFIPEDLDLDGDMDFIVVSMELSQTDILILKNVGNYIFETSTIFSDDRRRVEDLSIADANNDGHWDVLALVDRSLYFFKGEEGINFGEEERLTLRNNNLTGYPRSICITDINGDGNDDVVIGQNNDDAFWFKNISLDPLEFELAGRVGGANPAFSVRPFDINSDEAVDLFIYNGHLWLYENNVTQEMSQIEVDTTMTSSSLDLKDVIQRGRFGEVKVLSIVDKNNNIVLLRNDDDQDVDVSSLPPGEYTISISTPSGTFIGTYKKD